MGSQTNDTTNSARSEVHGVYLNSHLWRRRLERHCCQMAHVRAAHMQAGAPLNTRFAPSHSAATQAPSFVVLTRQFWSSTHESLRLGGASRNSSRSRSLVPSPRPRRHQVEGGSAAPRCEEARAADGRVATTTRERPLQPRPLAASLEACDFGGSMYFA